MTEPGAGSDAANIKTTATREGDHFLLNGTKQFISNGDRADTTIVFAANDLSLGAYGGITAFIVERSFGGIATSKLEKKMGIRSSSTAQITFQDCPVPKENILGSFGAGFLVALTTLDGGRASLSTGAVGGCEMALEAMVDWANEHPRLGSMQSVQWAIADTAIDSHVARLTSYASLEEVGVYFEGCQRERRSRRTSARRFQGTQRLRRRSAPKPASRSLERAIQVLGAEGYKEGNGLERGYRDSIIAEIYEGTNDIQRLVIARDMLGPDKQSF